VVRKRELPSGLLSVYGRRSVVSVSGKQLGNLAKLPATILQQLGRGLRALVEPLPVEPHLKGNVARVSPVASVWSLPLRTRLGLSDAAKSGDRVGQLGVGSVQLRQLDREGRRDLSARGLFTLAVASRSRRRGIVNGWRCGRSKLKTRPR
jgi:hypothetical protein